MIILIILIFVALFLLGIPILFVFGLISLFTVLLNQDYAFLIVFPQRMFAGPNMFILLAIPMFILAGKLMNIGGLSDRLIALAKSLFGHFKGGLAQVNIAASMFFSGISGSALADTAAIGSVLIPAMVEENYEKDFSAAITAISSTIGPIIPPSIAMIIYAAMSNVSVAALFIAGIVPGLLLGVGLMAGAYVYARKNNLAQKGQFSIVKFGRCLASALPALLFPVIILYGIFGGIFTPTEAAAVAVLYSILVGFFVYKDLNWSKIKKALMETGILCGAIMPIVSTTYILSWLVGASDVTTIATEYLIEMTSSPALILFIINLFLLLAGAILEPASSIILLAPTLLPIIEEIGVDPIHFGIIMVLNLVIGFATPPHGSCLFIASSISKVGIEKITKAILPFLFISLLVLAIVTYCPSLIMFLPNLLAN
jgi:C4-dicarboxylate transporter, DctM subunit